MASRLARLEACLADGDAAAHARDFSDDKLAGVATSLYRLRQLRTKFFDASLLTEPAWDMLLDLFIATVRGTRVATTSLCFAAGVPQATGLRVLGQLEEQGLLRRHGAADDRRLKLVVITPTGFQLMRQFLGETLTKLEALGSG